MALAAVETIVISEIALLVIAVLVVASKAYDSKKGRFLGRIVKRRFFG